MIVDVSVYILYFFVFSSRAEDWEGLSEIGGGYVIESSWKGAYSRRRWMGGGHTGFVGVWGPKFAPSFMIVLHKYIDQGSYASAPRM